MLQRSRATAAAGAPTRCSAVQPRGMDARITVGRARPGRVCPEAEPGRGRFAGNRNRSNSCRSARSHPRAETPAKAWHTGPGSGRRNGVGRRRNGGPRSSRPVRGSTPRTARGNRRGRRRSGGRGTGFAVVCRARTAGLLADAGGPERLHSRHGHTRPCASCSMPWRHTRSGRRASGRRRSLPPGPARRHRAAPAPLPTGPWRRSWRHPLHHFRGMPLGQEDLGQRVGVAGID